MVRRLVALLVLFVVSGAEAASITIEWVPALGATSYDIEQSVDQGTTWTVAKSISSSVCTTTKCSTTYSPPVVGLVIFRMVSYNAQGKSIRTHAGFWYNEKWTLPANAASAEIK